MKRETQQDKLNALLGLTTKAEEVKIQRTGNAVGITEDQIQKWREIQGLIYFLQAPHLFQPKTCKNCGIKFVVSRLFVSCCSYDCITEDLRNMGIEWTKGDDLEKLALDPQVYGGNEPLWVRESSLSKLKGMLDELLSQETPLSQTLKSPLDTTGSSTITTPSEVTQSSSSVPSQITPQKEPTKTFSSANGTKRGTISFG